MSTSPPGADAVRDYVEGYLPEDEALHAARERAAELGCVPVGPGGGAMLRFLAAALGARAVVEIGTGAGVSGLWLLRGMARDGVLTSVDVEPEHQRAARTAFADAGFPPGRVRMINGRALDILPRLADGAYDMVFIDAVKTEYPRYLDEAVRMLRPGGVVALDNVLWRGQVVDPARGDPATVALREVTRQVRDDERLVPALLPVGDGLLVALRSS